MGKATCTKRIASIFTEIIDSVNNAVRFIGDEANVPYSQLTWAAIRDRLKDRVEAVPFWEDAEALAAFNEGLTFFNLLTGYWHGTASVTTVANQYLYSLPATMLYRTRMEILAQPMSPSSREDLNNGRYTWRTETTASGGDVPDRPLLWAPVSLRLFYIWPADAVGNRTISVEGIAATPVLDADMDTIDLGDDLLNVLLGYALHALAFKKGGPFFAATQGYLKEFLIMAAEENDQIKTSKVYRRFMGLDHRDQKPLRGTPTRMDQAVGRVS